MVVVASWFTVLVATTITEELKRSDERSMVMAAVAAGVTLITMERQGLYARRPTLPRTEEISGVFVAVLGGAAALPVTAAFLDWHIGASEILLGWCAVFAGRIMSRGIFGVVEDEWWADEPTTRVVIVGTGHEARELADLVVDHPEARFRLAGVIGNLAVAERSGVADRWIGPTSRMTELMQAHKATGAIVTATGFRGDQFRSITRELFTCGYDVHLTTGVSRLGQRRFDIRSLAHEPLVVLGRNSIGRRQRASKRFVDVVGAVLILVCAAPVMAITALVIWLEDRGPILYTAPRIGRSGQAFAMFKFRSMVPDAEARKQSIRNRNERTGPLFKMTDDPRITRVGRIIRETSIDELPQLLNVVRGDMSLVGPRPALPEEGAAFDSELRDRFEVRPGITGLWQVEARSNAAFNAYRRLDLHYVENWTLTLDLRILLATAEQVGVSLLLTPLRIARGRQMSTDGVQARAGHASPPETVRANEAVIDLRSREPQGSAGEPNGSGVATRSSREQNPTPTSR
ncbi:MAG: sugar transferase [Actinomycetota bacterium]